MTNSELKRRAARKHNERYEQERDNPIPMREVIKVAVKDVLKSIK